MILISHMQLPINAFLQLLHLPQCHIRMSVKTLVFVQKIGHVALSQFYPCFSGGWRGGHIYFGPILIFYTKILKLSILLDFLPKKSLKQFWRFFCKLIEFTTHRFFISHPPKKNQLWKFKRKFIKKYCYQYWGKFHHLGKPP